MAAHNSPASHKLPPYKSKPAIRQAIIPASIGMLSVILGIRLFRIVDTYAVNLIYYDQFGFMTPFFKGADPWTMFTWQHGPHRQGLGELITWVVVRLSGWDTRAESFTILAALLLSLPLAFLLKYRLVRRVQVTDLILPVIILNVYQWEQLVRTPNLSHSVLPLLLILLYGLAWLIPSPPWRITSVLTTNFLLVFTGFGLFMGLITLAVFSLELSVATRRHQGERAVKSAIGLGGAVLTAWTFAHNWRIWPANYCFGLQWAYVPRYPAFMITMLARFVGVDFNVAPTAGVVVGILLLSGIIAAFSLNARAYVRDAFNPDQSSKIITMLTGFSLIFAGSTAVGRICFGMEAAQASRYVTLLIPGFLGLLLSISRIKVSGVPAALGLTLALLLAKCALPLAEPDRAAAQALFEAKTRWRECYLLSGDYLGCNESTGFAIYPPGPDLWAAMHPEYAADGSGPARIIGRLDYLKERHLNLYQDAP